MGLLFPAGWLHGQTDTLYWVNGSGSWSDAGQWAAGSGGAGGAGVPDDQTTVIFDQNSFSSAGEVVDIDVPTAHCYDMTWDDLATPWDPIMDGDPGNVLNIHSSVTLLSTMQMAFTGDIIFSATDSNNTININDLLLDNALVFQSSGKWTLQDEIRTRNVIDFQSGFLDADEFEIMCDQFYSDYTTTRALDISFAIFQLSKAAESWYVRTDNFDLEAVSSYIILHGQQPEMINFGADTLVFSGVLFADTSSNATLQFGIYFQVLFSGDGVLEDHNDIDSLYFTPGKTYEITTSQPQYISSGWYSIGADCFPITIKSNVPGTQATIETGKLRMRFEHNIIQDIDIDGVGNYNAGEFSADSGNNSGLIFGQANLVYTNLLGNDTLLCQGDTKLLTTRYYWETAKRQWQDNTTDRTYQVSQAGTYHVRLTYHPGCHLDDTIRIDYSDVTVDLGPDTILCAGDELVLDTEAQPSWNVTWQDQSTASELTVTEPGTYAVEVEDTNGCVAFDSVVITESPLPLVNLPADTAICANDTLVLQPSPDNNLDYQWHDGSTGAAFTATTEGTYSVTVTDGNGCSNNGEMDLTVNALPNLALGNDAQICEGDNLVLDVNVSNSSYSWNTGATSKSITVSEEGNYSVTVTDDNNCQASDDLYVAVRPVPEFSISDTALCFDKSGPVTFDGPAAQKSYAWSTGDTSRQVTLHLPGSYSLEVTSENNCTYKDHFDIENDCSTEIHFPTAFSPNGDGVNDRFTTVPVNVRSVEYRIYNRWGEMIFTTGDEQCNWTGHMHGEKAPAGMYVVMAKGIDNFGIPFERRANVLVIR